jgi:hypothetical protein
MEPPRQNEAWWQDQHAARELARAVAFANVDLSARRAFVDITVEETDDKDFRWTCRYAPFRSEIARALRMPDDEVAAFVGDDHDQHAAFRPVCGVSSSDVDERTQANIRALLDGIITCKEAVVIATLWGLTTRIDVALRRPATKSRKLHPMQLRAIHQPSSAYDSLRYAVVLGAPFYHRLAHCEACGRFILGKTDRPVRYCADVRCQTHASRPGGDAPTKAAKHTRAYRDRTNRWYEHAGLIRTALQGAPTPGHLRKLVRQGRKLLDECFRWGNSKSRAGAEALLDQADRRSKAVAKARPVSR